MTNENNHEPAPAPVAERRSGTATALAVTGIAVGSVLLLGVTFGGGVVVGTLLPDRGPGQVVAVSEHREGLHDRVQQRVQERLQERREDRMQDRLDERSNRPAPEEAPDQG